MANIQALILDFDGVLIESNQVKTDAFKELFSLYPEYEEAMLAYHLRCFSTSRMDKFRYFVYELMERPGDENLISDIAEKFSNLVMKRVVSCPEVPGASEFLSEFSQRVPLYISSATPQEELRNIIRYRGFETYFRDIYGDPPVRKIEAIQTVIKRERIDPQEVLFIGDSLSDLNAAWDTSVRFVGRNSGLPFPDGDIKLYKDMFEIAEVIRQQLGENPF